jgi:putative transposase
MITADFETHLYKYMTGIIQDHGHKMLIINGLADHVHVLAGIRPVESISDICEYLKASSSKWINDNGFTKEKFRWQSGFGAFSYSLSDLPSVIRYIDMQKLTHESIRFKDEYLSLLNEYDVAADERYLFDFFD